MVRNTMYCVSVIRKPGMTKKEGRSNFLKNVYYNVFDEVFEIRDGAEN